MENIDDLYQEIQNARFMIKIFDSDLKGEADDFRINWLKERKAEMKIYLKSLIKRLEAPDETN